MDQDKLEQWINSLIKEDKLCKFYKSKWWRGNKDTEGLKNEVLKEQHYECQECKKKGIKTTADTVHHVQFVRKHPRLALSKFYKYKGKQYKNLIAVCRDCHNKLHPEKHSNKPKFITEEKW